ncbi:efflux RND transporter periplasmic adaptor subunit [Variovorax boronicumulans]|uniref:efflux RND transporter periplasmic adaptor subunit n=1 Tax=Variovorax boronicumulans TaxID=436515 RepID=UPI0033931DF3
MQSPPESPRLSWPVRLWRIAKPRAAAGIVLAVAVAAGLWLGPRFLLGPRVEATTVVRRDFVQSVVASGHVQTPHRVNIGTQVTGTVKRVPVAEGQTVRAGQLLVELENAEWSAALAQADASVLQARARLRQLREVQAPVAAQTVRQAQVNLDNARAQWRRSTSLFQQGFVGQAALDDVRKVVDLAEAQLRTAQSQFDSARAGGSDDALAQTELAQSMAGSAVARSRLVYATIVAPVDGTLIDRAVEPGDVVQPGKALMVLSPVGKTQLVVQIDERNLQLLEPGHKAQASADAYPERRLAAELVYINPGVDLQRGSVEVKLDVPEPPDYLRQDMTVSVDIQVARRPQAVLVASDAVRGTDSAQPWVLKVDGRHARRQPVRLGLHGGGFSEVLEGLLPGDLVLSARTADIEHGSRVRATVVAPAQTHPPSP